MRHIGHTMATPEMEMLDALAMFAELGFDGTEVISMTIQEQGDRHGPAAGDARIFSHDWPSDEIGGVARTARGLGVPFMTVTQYVKAVNSPDAGERGASVDAVSRYVDFAEAIGARFVRVYGGADGFGPDSRADLMDSIRKLARAAEAKGITLLVENHPGTLALTGEDTAAIVREVGHPSVRALYDPANVLYHSHEAWRETLSRQQGLVAYVHVKDYRVEEDKRVACPVGEGVVPWPDILRVLRDWGYDGPLSYEYERKWNRDQLPDARTGLKSSLAYVKQLLS